jgi:hypothetical protein
MNDVQHLMATISGMREKLADFKRFRANYQNMRMLWKAEHSINQLQAGWIAKLERCIREAIEDSSADSVDLRKYLEKVLESKPSALLSSV